MTPNNSPLPGSSASQSLRFHPEDFVSGIVVFLVALPLCLGIALASDAPLFSGLIAGIVGGIVVGALSGSHTSVSGPAAGLTAIVAAQITLLGSFEAFLLAVMVGGVLQIGLGLLRAGTLSAFFPSSVIKGLLAAIGVILILKQIPHLLGHDNDPEGEMSFAQPDDQTTFSELGMVLGGDIHAGAVVVGLLSIGVLLLWAKWKPLKNSIIPGPLMVVLLGVGLNIWFQRLGDSWVIGPSHLVQIPVPERPMDVLSFFNIPNFREVSNPVIYTIGVMFSIFASLATLPDFTQILNPQIYLAGITIAIVASLETLLNLQAVDKLDHEKRVSPPSRELIAQGAGNIVAGLIGGIPVTSVIVRGSVNVASGAKSKVSAIFHGVILAFSVVMLPTAMNMIPLASLAAILLVTGFKLASPALFRQMSQEGRYQFIPFIVTLGAIVVTDLLTGILIGLGVSVLFILNSNLRRPIRRTVKTHVVGDVHHVQLANQVTFLNRAAISELLDGAKEGTRLLLDGSDTDFIDPDVLGLVREFKTTAVARGVELTLRGFRDRFQLNDEPHPNHASPELQARATPNDVLRVLQEGNRRFRTGNQMVRDLSQQAAATATQQSPLAVVLSCIDSRVPTELVFDLGIGDIFSVRVAGNIIGSKLLGSVEYGVAVAGVKLVLVMGHTRCGAITSSVSVLAKRINGESPVGCPHLQAIVDEIEPVIDESDLANAHRASAEQLDKIVNAVSRKNVLRTVREITERSPAIRDGIDEGRVLVVGAVYDVKTGEIEFLDEGIPAGE